MDKTKFLPCISKCEHNCSMSMKHKIFETCFRLYLTDFHFVSLNLCANVCGYVNLWLWLAVKNSKFSLKLPLAKTVNLSL